MPSDAGLKRAQVQLYRSPRLPWLSPLRRSQGLRILPPLLEWGTSRVMHSNERSLDIGGNHDRLLPTYKEPDAGLYHAPPVPAGGASCS